MANLLKERRLGRTHVQLGEKNESFLTGIPLSFHKDKPLIYQPKGVIECRIGDIYDDNPDIPPGDGSVPEDTTLFFSVNRGSGNDGNGNIAADSIIAGGWIHRRDPDGTVTKLFDFGTAFGNTLDLTDLVIHRGQKKLYLLYPGNRIYAYDLVTEEHTEYHIIAGNTEDCARIDIMQSGTYDGHIFFKYAYPAGDNLFRLEPDGTQVDLGYTNQLISQMNCREATQEVFIFSAFSFQVWRASAATGAKTALSVSQFGSVFGPTTIHTPMDDLLVVEQGGSGGKVITLNPDTGGGGNKKTYGWGTSRGKYSPSDGKITWGGSPMTIMPRLQFNTYSEIKVKNPADGTLIGEAEMGSYGVECVEAW